MSDIAQHCNPCRRRCQLHFDSNLGDNPGRTSDSGSWRICLGRNFCTLSGYPHLEKIRPGKMGRCCWHYRLESSRWGRLCTIPSATSVWSTCLCRIRCRPPGLFRFEYTLLDIVYNSFVGVQRARVDPLHSLCSFVVLLDSGRNLSDSPCRSSAALIRLGSNLWGILCTSFCDTSPLGMKKRLPRAVATPEGAPRARPRASRGERGPRGASTRTWSRAARGRLTFRRRSCRKYISSCSSPVGVVCVRRGGGRGRRREERG